MPLFCEVPNVSLGVACQTVQLRWNPFRPSRVILRVVVWWRVLSLCVFHARILNVSARGPE